MKKISIFLMSVTLLIATACEEFLNVTPVSVVSEETLFTESGFEGLVVGMYNSMYTSTMSGGQLSGEYLGNILGSDANKASTATDQPPLYEIETYIFSSTNVYVEAPWSTFYAGVHRANQIIDYAEKMKDNVDQTILNKREVEARFLRAVWYFDLIKHYGAAVPWVGLEEYRSAADPQVSNVDESGNYIYIWDKVIDEFDYAYQNLPEIQTDLGRPNKWAALAYKTKVMIFRASPYNGTNDAGKSELWSAIKSNLETLIAQGVTSSGEKYALVDDYGSLFDATTSDNTSENVFEIQQAISGTSTVGNTGTTGSMGYANVIVGLMGWNFVVPSQDLAQSYLVDPNGKPYLNYGYQDITSQTTMGTGSTILVDRSMFMDPRVDFNVGRYWIPFLDWDVPTSYESYARAISHGGNYFEKKNMPTHSDWNSGLSVGQSRPGSTVKNIHLIRYADILLWYAEALIETGDLDGARTYINMVRQRAANSYVAAAKMDTESGFDNLKGVMTPTTSEYVVEFIDDGGSKTIVGENAAANYRIGLWSVADFDTKEKATAALRAEYRAEFGMEGRRWFDLCRWGIVQAENNKYTAYESQFLSKFDGIIYPAKAVTLPIPNSQIVTMQGLLVQNENWK